MDDPNDHAPLIERAFALEPREHADVPVDVQGHLPPDLIGTAFLNGPARFSRGALRYRHWLDGDGMVCALRFSREARGDRPARDARDTRDARNTRDTRDARNTRVSFSNRFVRTTKFQAEETHDRPLYRTFGTAFDGDNLKRGVGLESPANVSVYAYDGALLALGEQGLPWDIDPTSLETRGPFTFGGQLNEITPFGAHPKIDHHTNELFNFGVSFSQQQPTLNLFRFRDAKHLVYRRRLPLPYAASIHDFAITARHVAFYVSPLLLDVNALMQSGATAMDALSWQPERGSRLLVASRETGAQIASIDIGYRYCLHLINAFDTPNEPNAPDATSNRLVVDVIEYEKPLYPEYQIIPNLFTDTFRGGPVRLVIDLPSATIVERREIAYTCSPDFPAHDPALTGQPYDHFWMLGISQAGCPGRKFFDQLVRVDWRAHGAAARTTNRAHDRTAEHIDIYQAPPANYLGGEPLFIPQADGGPQAGYVLCQIFDAASRTASFVLFDAFNLSCGPLATLTLPDPIPLLFHSSFAGPTSFAGAAS